MRDVSTGYESDSSSGARDAAWGDRPARKRPRSGVPTGLDGGPDAKKRRRTMNSRREFLKAGGALVIGLNLRETLVGQQPAAGVRTLDLRQIDTWLAIHADNTATVYIGFAELGQGASTAL